MKIHYDLPVKRRILRDQTHTKRAIIGVSVLLLSACANQPASEGQIGAWVGYQEQQLSDSRYQISYTDRGDQTDLQAAWTRIENLWHMRAKELCGNDSYRSSDLEQSTPCRTHFAVYGQYLRKEKQCLMELTGVADCQR